MDKTLFFDIACPHCKNVLNEPVTMPCTHHICTSCMQTLAEGRSKFNCPDCKVSVPVVKCIPNHLMHKVIHELSTTRISEVSPITTGPPMPLAHLPAQPQNVAFLKQTLNAHLNVAQHQYPIHVQPFLPLHNKPPIDAGLHLQLPPGVPPQKAQPNQSADRLVLTHNQRQYIRYVVVTDCDTGIKYTVGIKHVLNTVGSNQLVQLLEKNIGSEYKKGSSKRVCKSVVNGVFCPQGSECPFIHVTQEGWEARRKFSSANQKRNKDALGLSDTAPPLAGTLLDPGLLPFGGLETPPASLPVAPGAPAGLGSGWAAPAVGLGPALSAPVSLGMFAGGSLPHLPRGPPEHMDGGRGQREVGAQRSHSAGPQAAAFAAPRFPLPISNGFPNAHFDFGAAGLDIADLRPQPDFRLQGTAFGSSNPIPFLGNPLPLNTLGACTSSSSSSTDARTPQESSAASTSSSIGAISSCSYTGSPLASPLIESIATAELPEPLVEKPNDFAEGSSRIPYFNLNNLLGSLGPRDDGACPCPGQ
eukprot:EG_transcript_2583